jgi:8-oxo-dGTP pyrophosphatase MutT (NUDIX family)
VTDGVRPAWLEEVVAGADSIRASDLTGFAAPEGSSPRESAVLMLFADGEDGPDLLLTERSHTMRSHPGQVSFPGGRLDPGETPDQAALREAYEETGLDPAGVEIVAHLPQLWLPPSNFHVTPVLAWWRAPAPLRVASPAEVHAIYRVSVRELRDPSHRIRVTSPRTGWMLPGFLIGPGKDVILWGFTGGVVHRFLQHLGWIEEIADAPVVELPDYMLVGRERSELER